MLRLAPLLLLALAACSLADGWGRLPESADGLVVNKTAESVHVFAVDAETAALIDLNPEFDITDQLVVGAGEAAPFEIDGYERGDDIVVFVYRVADGRALYTTAVTASAREFARDDETVTITAL